MSKERNQVVEPVHFGGNEYVLGADVVPGMSLWRLVKVNEVAIGPDGRRVLRLDDGTEMALSAESRVATPAIVGD